MKWTKVALLWRLGLYAAANELAAVPSRNTPCPGYEARTANFDGTTVTADLSLAGTPCNLYGTDLRDLRLVVEYQSETRLHVKISDAAEQVYQVSESVFPRPQNDNINASNATLAFSWTASPFTFKVTRKHTNETLFDSSAASLIFENQYVRLRTWLPKSPHLYGLGEHTDPFHLNTTNYTRTFWNRDAYGTPPGTNLYGQHPIYFDHRGSTGTHGVFLLSSNGMDIKIDSSGGQYLEINTIGGIIDLYFLAGPTPKNVSVQYSEIVGKAAMQPYWGFGFHQCRYGYRDVYAVAEVVANYSLANIPLETMWTDIDYMDLRKVFTLDPQRFPLKLVRELVNYLHAHQQHYIVMVDPAVAQGDNEAYNAGIEANIFQKNPNGSVYTGVVWPGAAVFPDWFHPATQKYWNNQFLRFFDADTGVDIDALWIDMNEASNFCPYPCADPPGYAEQAGNPPEPPPVRNNSGRPIPNFPPEFQPSYYQQTLLRQHRALLPRQTNETSKWLGLSNRDLISPQYQIQNVAGSISNLTVPSNLQNYDGSFQYDTHNLYGLMMSIASRDALIARRPTKRPLVITRSTFAGAGNKVGKWLGDNVSTWVQYRFSIAGMLGFASLYQVPMIGTDVCGFADNTTENLCARWATLGAFYPFYRNHNGFDSIAQEFYIWPTVAEAARNAIGVRYRLLDYIYTHLHRQTTTGLPLLNPMFFLYPDDANTFAIEHQFFYGDNVLVSPVTEEDSTSVSIYLPNDIFYDYWTHEKIQGNGSYMQLTDIPFSSIPLHIRGGSILPLRAESTNTTTELRKQDFVLWIAVNAIGQASGSLYLDDGDSITQNGTSDIRINYDGGQFTMTGTFGYTTDIVITNVTVLGEGSHKRSSRTVQGPISLNKETTFEF